MIRLFPIITLTREVASRVQGQWFRLSVRPPRKLWARIKWEFDFRGRRQAREYLDCCVKRISIALTNIDRERLAHDLAIYGRVEFPLPSSDGGAHG